MKNHPSDLSDVCFDQLEATSIQSTDRQSVRIVTLNSSGAESRITAEVAVDGQPDLP